jgi:hypothetical protein
MAATGEYRTGRVMDHDVTVATQLFLVASRNGTDGRTGQTKPGPAQARRDGPRLSTHRPTTPTDGGAEQIRRSSEWMDCLAWKRTTRPTGAVVGLTPCSPLFPLGIAGTYLLEAPSHSPLLPAYP